MFFIEATSPEAMEAACELILQYGEVHTEFTSETTMSVHEVEGHETDYRLCEMAFQGSFHQKAEYLCAACKAEIEKTGEGEATCGHITFTKPINYQM